ncbi:MAG: hypothetical protein JSS12_09275, partial [Verrucomicrobia bacterium]|nr:hypothetical protein [Verrucomicrobiota bacterium]
IVVQQLPKSLSLVPRLSPNPSLARQECLKAAEKLKPGRFMLFGDITNRCLAVQTTNSKFKYTPNVEATFKGPVQNVATGKWTLSKRDLTLDEVIIQFGGMCDLISLERLPLASPSKIEDAQNIQPGQFILLRNKDQSVLAVKKTLEGAVEQTRYEHDLFAGTFIQKQRGGAKEFTNRVSLSEIVREQGGVQNLCLNKLVSQGPSLQEPQPANVRDLPHWSVLTWDTFLGDFKAGEFVLFRNLKDDSVVVCMNRGEKGAKVDPVFHTLSTVVVNGKETYVDANKKTYNSLKELIAHLGGSDRLRYDKLYSSINEQKSNYDLVEG